MRILVLGAGFYGCHIALDLVADGHEVAIHDIADRVFAGASGNCPARLHLGAPHYPRSGATQAACAAHQQQFLARYGFLTRHVPTNIYAVAAHDSLIDATAFKAVLDRSIDYIPVYDPAEYGLQNVEAAFLTGERHIVTDMAAAYFTRELGDRIQLNSADAGWTHDIRIDCTFAARTSIGVDRYEPCLTVMLEGPTDRATTIVDGPFGGIYPWNESLHLSTLTSAKLTPLSKTCRSYDEARALLNAATVQFLGERAELMMEEIANFWPGARDLYRIVDFKTAIRAMPRSGADSRLVDVQRLAGGVIQVRAGKIDAVLQASEAVRAMVPRPVQVMPL